MNPSDFARIENATGIPLPNDLRELYVRYPFAPDSWAAELAMPDDPELIIRWNTVESVAELFGLNLHEVLQIGSDGGESLYFANVTGPETAVLEADLETGKVTSHDPDLFSWVLHLNAQQDEIDRDEEQMARRRWWQFWKR